jgi:iron(III) transport system ATP-binding protein
MTSSLPPHDIAPIPAKGKAAPVFAGEVSFEGVSYVINGKTILDNVSLTVPAGKIACLVGPSGCGKTTLLRLAAGILRPASGRILLDQQEVAGPKRHVPPERRNVGLVFQDFALFPHMTVLENVAYGLTALDRREALRVAAIALQRVGLSHVTHLYPTLLSGGEQQRVALARAVVPRPQVLLLDEPFSGLDQRLKEAVRDDTLALLKETRATAILVTHDPEEALAVADQIHVMQQGRIAQSGTPDELIHKPQTLGVARFFRNHNQFQCVVRHGRIETPIGSLKASHMAEGARVEALVPPTAITVQKSIGNGNATIVDNRDLGVTRRLLARLHSDGQMVLVYSTFDERGEVTLAVTSNNTHIFEVSG